jgi:hypothetical protein
MLSKANGGSASRKMMPRSFRLTGRRPALTLVAGKGDGAMDVHARTISELAARHRVSIAEFDPQIAVELIQAVSRLARRHSLTGRLRTAGQVIMLETRSEDRALPGARFWFGGGASGVYRVTEGAWDNACYHVVAETMDDIGDVWDRALPLTQFSLSRSVVCAPIKRITRDFTVAPDPAVRAAAEEMRDAQLELAMQAVAACDLFPDIFKRRTDNPWLAAARQLEEEVRTIGEAGRPDDRRWELGHHFAVVSAWNKMRRGRPGSQMSDEARDRALNLLAIGAEPTGRTCQAGAVLMFEGEDEARCPMAARGSWRGKGAGGRQYRVETCVDGVGNIVVEAFVHRRSRRGHSDECIHEFVLADSTHTDVLVPPGQADEGSLKAIEAVFEAQLAAAFDAVARHEAASAADAGSKSLAA